MKLVQLQWPLSISWEHTIPVRQDLHRLLTGLWGLGLTFKSQKGLRPSYLKDASPPGNLSPPPLANLSSSCLPHPSYTSDSSYLAKSAI